MQPITRILALRFDAISRRYIGDVALFRQDGSERTVRASVIGHPGWPLERVARQLIGAARLQQQPS
jgi:hypothetical protein